MGLSIATLLSQHHQVTAVDIVSEKVELINNRKSPIQDDYIEKYLAEKELNLTATLDAKAAYSDADFVVIAAPTNYDSHTQHFDTSAVEAVIKLVMEYNPNAIMVIKSTIPVGYTASVREKFGSKNIIFSPEFLRESKARVDYMLKSFFKEIASRPICYECPFKKIERNSDLTVYDCWGIEKAAPEFDDNKGVSLVLVNNEAGERAFEKVKEMLIWKPTKLEDSLQPPLKAPFPKPENRDQFWSDFENKSFEYVAKKYGGIGFKNDAKSLLRKIKKKIKKLVVKGGKRNSSNI